MSITFSKITINVYVFIHSSKYTLKMIQTFFQNLEKANIYNIKCANIK